MIFFNTKTVGAYGCMPYEAKIAKRLTYMDRFGEKYELFRVDDGDIWVPRGIVRESEKVVYDQGPVVHLADNFQPYPKYEEDQTRVVAEACALLDNNEDFILQAPTGYGKTYLGAKLISHVNRRALVITTKEDIVGDTNPPTQWMKAIMEVNGLQRSEIGVWRGDKEPNPKHKVVIGLVQSIMKGPDRYGSMAYKGFGLVICDEVHRMGAEHFSQAMWWLPSQHRVGLSATPYRKDGREKAFKYHIGPVKVKAEQDVMVPKVIMQQTNWKVPMVHWYGSYQKMPHTAGKTMGVEKTMYAHTQRNDLITQFCKAAVAKGRNTIVFSSGLKHLEALQDAFIEAGISPHKIGWYVGLQNYGKGVSKDEKIAMRESAKTKPLILATYSMASEATDIPWLDCAVFGTPRADVVQIAGRIRREWEGKPQPVIFDLVDTDSRIFKAYWGKRKNWYQQIGAPITVMNSY